MPTRAELGVKANQLREAIHEIENSDRTRAEKNLALDNVQKDYDAYQVELKSVRPDDSEQEEQKAARSAKWLKALGAGGDSGPVQDMEEDPGESIAPLSYRKAAVARELMRSPQLKANLERVRKGLAVSNDGWEIGLKDATESGNIMGEGLYGGTGPTAAGQSPFLPGAVGPGIQPDWLPGIVDLRYFPLRFSELLSSFATDAPNLSYLVEATSNRQATSTAEAAAFPFSSGTFSRVYEQIGKVSNAMVLTDETVEDAPLLRNFLQNTLLDGVVRQEDFQLLAGGGYPGVNGLLNRTTGFTKPESHSAETNVVIPASATPGLGGQPITIASLTHGKEITGTGSGVAPSASEVAEGIFNTYVNIEYNTQFSPTATVMNPLDWATIRTGKDSNGQYYGGSWFFGDYGQAQNGGQVLWGKPVVTTAAMPQGYILTGYFGPECIRTARRRGIVFQQTNSNESDFIQGKVTMRADSRLGLVVFRPSVFTLIKLVNGS
jgi:HK97 family phage major capsid protein